MDTWDPKFVADSLSQKWALLLKMAVEKMNQCQAMREKKSVKWKRVISVESSWMLSSVLWGLFKINVYWNLYKIESKNDLASGVFMLSSAC